MKTLMMLLSALLAAVCISCVMLFPVTPVQGMVAGVDFGGEFFKIALVKPGTPFEIVTNIHSKRKTETMVAFDGEERLYGADAATVGVRRPQTAYSQIRRFLGTTVSHPQVVSLLKEEYFPYELLQNDTRGSVALKHGKNKVFHAEELAAMVFSHARQITNAFAEAKVNDWVLTVPCFFSQAQRQAVLDAAELAGVRVLSLINENTAAALQLGVYSTFPEEKYRVLIYNMGSTSLQVSIVEYTSRVVPDGFKKNKTEIGFEVLSKAWDENLGGSKFDLRLAEHLAKEFSEKIKEDVRKVPRAMAKIRAQAKKTKTVLSANEEIPVVMQSLYKDTDFFSHMTRTKFEEMCTDLYEKALLPVEKALEKSGLQLKDIHEVEIVGGAVRMPKIQQLLKDYFVGKDLGVHLNGDEAMALGAAFHGANISNAFRVRNVPMTDIASYAVGVRLVDLDNAASHHQKEKDSGSSKHWVKRAALFTETSRLGQRKSVAFSHDKDISCAFRYDQPSSLPAGVSAHIGKFNITGVEAFAKKHEAKLEKLGLPKVTLSFELDANGIMKIAKAEATLEEEVEVEVEVEVPVEETEEEKKAREEEEAKEAEEEEKEAEEEEDGEKKKKDDKKSKKSSKKDKKSKKKAPKTTKKLEKQMKKKTHRAVLSVKPAHDELPTEATDMSVLPMSVAAKKDSIRMLREMEEADDRRKANLEAKNRLETFVYKSRDTLSGPQEAQIVQVTLPEQLEKLSSALEETEDWLYDDGEKADAATYNKKKKDLADQLDAILFRVSELKELPSALSTAKEYAFSTRELMKEWEESKPQVTEEERQDVLEKVEELEKWMEAEEAKQKKVKAHETPVLTSKDVEKKTQSVKKLVSSLSKKPKPKPVKTKKEEEEEEAEDKKKEDKDAEKKEEEMEETKKEDDKKKKEDKEEEEEEEDERDEL